MQTLWMGVMPGPSGVRILVQEGPARTLLKAVLPHAPKEPRALAALCEALALWVDAPVRAALCADDEGILSDESSWLESVEAFADARAELKLVVGHRRLAEEEANDELGAFDEVRAFVGRWVAP